MQRQQDEGNAIEAAWRERMDAAVTAMRERDRLSDARQLLLWKEAA